MVDARKQIKELLEEIEINGMKVSMNFPKEIDSVPLITFFEINNSNTDTKFRDSISYQIDVWAGTFETVIDMAMEASKKLENLGLKRDYVSPDSDSIDASGLYRKTLRYSRHVDIRTNRLID
jgi:hypothetical protein